MNRRDFLSTAIIPLAARCATFDDIWARQAVFFVATHGRDHSAGVDAEHPTTWNSAMERMQNGDTVWLLSGYYGG